MKGNSVWVLELNIAKVGGQPSKDWTVWSAFNTRGEAVKARNVARPENRHWFRIRKYLPEDESL